MLGAAITGSTAGDAASSGQAVAQTAVRGTSLADRIAEAQATERALAASRSSARTAPTPTAITSVPSPTPSNVPTAPSTDTIVGGFEPVPDCAAQVPAALPPNGRLGADELCPIGDGHELRADAAATFVAMSAAFRLTFGSDLCVTDSYRSYASQVSLYARKPSLAAVPGTSNHGWGIAVDMFCGVGTYSTPQYAWMSEHGPAYGWTNPDWARHGGSRPEPWHWEFDASLVE